MRTSFPNLRISREIESRLEQVDAVCREIRILLQEASLSSLSFVVELLARECLNNAVIHGNLRDATKRVRMRLRSRGGRVCLRVSDDGPGFDWRTVRWEPPAKNVRPMGRGLPILASYAERIRFNPQGNQITLWLRPDAERT